MKKLFFVVPILGIGLLLAGCGKVEGGVVNCTLYTNDAVNGYTLNSTYKINYTGEYVDSVESEEIVTSEDTDILNYFETTLTDTYDKTSAAYGGYDYSVNNDGSKVVSTVTIDYKKMDLEQFITDQPTLKSYSKDNKLLVEGVKTMYESMGATCSE